MLMFPGEGAELELDIVGDHVHLNMPLRLAHPCTAQCWTLGSMPEGASGSLRNLLHAENLAHSAT
jgi:hypothetical protein